MQPDRDQNGYWQAPEQPQANTDPAAQPSPYEQPLPDVASPPENSAAQPAPAPDSLMWQASEYIHHEKQLMWFIGLGAGALILVAVAVLMQLWTFVLLIVVMTIAIVYMGMRPPRVITYQLLPDQVVVGERRFGYDSFRSFGVLHDGALYSIVLSPNRRFMPEVRMYFPQELGEPIVDILGSRLPMEAVEQDIMDRLMRKLRF